MSDSLYDNDFYAWSMEQKQLLESRQFDSLDIDRLIEEVEDMGNSRRRALESRFDILLAHLLKYQYQPERKSRSWQLTVIEQREQIKILLRKNPSLKKVLNETFIDAYEKARLRAMKETFLDVNTFPAECPWTMEEALAQLNISLDN